MQIILQMGFANPSPEGRGWTDSQQAVRTGEGCSNGAVSVPLTRRCAAPSPFRRGIHFTNFPISTSVDLVSGCGPGNAPFSCRMYAMMFS